MKPTDQRLLNRRLAKRNDRLQGALLNMQIQRQMEERMKLMLLAAIVRKFGTADASGAKTLNLSEPDLEVPKGESLTATQVNEPRGVILKVEVPPVAEAESVVVAQPEPITDPSRLLPATTQPHPDDKEASTNDPA